jgi:phosphate transport system substrate-binding protein
LTKSVSNDLIKGMITKSPKQALCSRVKSIISCWSALLLTVTLTTVLNVAQGWASGPVAPLTICGTGDSQQLFRQIGILYMDLHPEIRVDVPDSIGSSGGIKATAAGKCDLGRVARTLKEKEERYGLHYRTIAKSPVVFVVNNTLTGITEISTEEIVSIYSGMVTDWQTLGGSTGKIYLINREKGDSSRTVIENKIPGFSDIENLAGVTLYSTPETADAIAHHPQTIGYISLAQKLSQSGIRVLRLNGIAPTTNNIMTGHYPLLVPFGLVWKESLKPAGQEFLKFLSSPAAQQLMKKQGVWPVANLP